MDSFIGGGSSVWTAGTISFGREAGSDDGHFRSTGVTIGIDKRLSEKLIIGMAAGLGFDKSTSEDDGMRVESQNLNGALYGSYHPYKSIFIDGLIGYGKASFDTRRFVPTDNLYVTGDRSGDEFFGSVALSYELDNDNLRFASYVRLDMLHAALDSYSEEGSNIWALEYDDVQINSLSSVVGVHLSYDISQDWGLLSPALGLEYSHTAEEADTQNISYADLSGSRIYGINQNTNASDIMTARIGLSLYTYSKFAAELEYSANDSGLTIDNQQFRLGLTYRF